MDKRNNEECKDIHKFFTDNFVKILLLNFFLCFIDHLDRNDETDYGTCGNLLIFLSYILFVVTLPISIFMSLKVKNNYNIFVLSQSYCFKSELLKFKDSQ